ncbi:Uncharacterised protein [Segatella copri]|nr:Uncharacterised protein [Segatella copri]
MAKFFTVKFIAKEFSSYANEIWLRMARLMTLSVCSIPRISTSLSCL